MRPYKKNNCLIISSLNDLYNCANIASLCNEAGHFRGKDSRFYRIISNIEFSKSRGYDTASV